MFFWKLGEREREKEREKVFWKLGEKERERERKRERKFSGN